MSKVRIAFDIDGTLRCNCTNTCDEGNQKVYDLFMILYGFENTELYVWSGGGAEYAFRFAQKFGLPVKKSRCISKIGAPQMDIAIDDMKDFSAGNINLIMRNK